jgi:hypothetical protein
LAYDRGTAQEEFLKAYIIDKSMDTVFGEIDNKGYNDASLFCDFRLNKNENTKRYYPNDLYGYRFNDGKYYVAKQISINSKDTVFFFEYLINGELDVFFRQDGFENHYYVSLSDNDLRELKYIKEYVYKGDKKYVKENKQYEILLQYLAKDYPVLLSKVKRIAEPDHDNLIDFAKEYHELTCKDGNCIIYEKKRPRNVKIEMMGHINHFVNPDILSEKPFYPSCGVNVLFQQSKSRERFYVGLGIAYPYPIFFAREEKIRFIFSIPLSFYYLHPKQGLSPFFSYTVNCPFFLNHSLKAGANIHIKSFSFLISGGMETYMVIKPMSFSGNFGIIFDLNK